MLVINKSEFNGSRFSKLNLTASVAQRAVSATASELEAKTPDNFNGSSTTSSIEGEHGLR
jgi:hypothetical protein